MIFEGGVEFDELEKQHIEKFKEYARKQNEYDVERYSDAEILKFMQAEWFKVKKAYVMSVDRIKYEKEWVP